MAFPRSTNDLRPARRLISRRDVLSRVALGMGAIALQSLLNDERRLEADGRQTSSFHDVLSRQPHFPPRARRIVLLFQHGGPSQLDLFDPKPALERYAGKPVPGGVEAFFDKQDSGKCMPSPFRFSRHGECGMTFSELLPQLANCADDICQIRSMVTELNDHEGAIRLFQTGQGRVGRPSLGSWVTYGLGSENRNLPAYVVLADPKGYQLDGIDDKQTDSYGTRCLMARRLLEKGVRFVSVFNDLIMGDPWDTHSNHNERIRKIARNVDRPAAALIQDLKRGGLLEDTVVIWAGEFGRLPVGQGKDGRDHNRHAFATLLAGGGIQPGLTHGVTDEFG